MPGVVVIEAGVVVGYVVAWAVRKARRVGVQLDAEADAVIDAGLDRLHEAVAAKLGAHPVLAQLVDEAVAGAGGVRDLTRRQVELALTAAAHKDETFGQVVTDLVLQLRGAEQATGRSVIAGTVFSGDAYARAERGGIAFGQVAGDVNVVPGPVDPPWPGRPSH